jgi:hypothetical protein
MSGFFGIAPTLPSFAELCAAQDLRTALQRHEAAAGPKSKFPVTLVYKAGITKATYHINYVTNIR